ncbi:DUF2834 domain-containing protein [Phormidium tenue]|uniref:DUF2834 domain-containing protein n=1 Tax=Phormidium tenue NIES-30 TaxID=549789 RepID=A0A1U7J4F8_9CYAN|nr:DUF2834 domain-containing protein [Phormidium tenue]MBD2232920.1 DUF2834 domain-containing protein [Phormidium tenue FACHB-1052]OKH47402.1 DUF2834 domain-containing protein [Phormidium tenue NIES-30]
MNRLIFWGLWLGFILYTFILAPPDRPDTADLILKLSTGAWEGINPAVVALFNAMGIWPMVYAAVALIDGHGQRQRAWPFVLVSFAVGAFALLPYLALRPPNPGFDGPKSALLRLLESRWLGAVLAAGAIALAAFALLKGDWLDFWQQWQTSRFIHVMSLDFVALWLLFPVLLRDDMARRGMSQPWVVAAVLALPLIGAGLYLALRPSVEAEAGTAVREGVGG